MIRFDQVTKRFPGVVALQDISFSIAAGECHALVGENGAGKSTLGKILAGIHRVSGGTLRINGTRVDFKSPLDASRAGISMVHQELAFCPNLSIAENLFLGRLPHVGPWVNRRLIRERTFKLLQAVGLDADPGLLIEHLSTAQEQMVQIAAAVGLGARIVIMDEPTSSLSHRESERLFEMVGRLKQQGVTLIYVSHRLEEIFRICDRITVLRDGRYIRTLPIHSTNSDEVVQLMIGRPVGEYYPDCVHQPAGEELLRVEGLTAPGRFEQVSFAVRAGEIVGLAGLVGAGRSEVARAIFGVDSFTQGQIFLRNRKTVIDSPRHAIQQGVGYLPEDRKRQGLVLGMNCRENLSLPRLARMQRWGFIQYHQERELVQSYFDALRIRAADMEMVIEGLSGGNQQKIAMAKWLALRCRVLILDEPTRGVDVGAKSEIHNLIDRLAGDGHGILLISSELPEVLCMSTRILVLTEGRLVGELSRQEANQEKLMQMMAGVKNRSNG